MLLPNEALGPMSAENALRIYTISVRKHAPLVELAMPHWSSIKLVDRNEHRNDSTRVAASTL